MQKLLAQLAAGKQMAATNQPRAQAAYIQQQCYNRYNKLNRGSCSTTTKLTIAMPVIVHARVPLMIVSLPNLPLEGAYFGLGGQLVKWLYIAS